MGGLAVLSACAASSNSSEVSLAEIETSADTQIWSGYYRQGFEQSDFYTREGEGPYWLSGAEDVFEQFIPFLSSETGRGRATTVELTVEGTLDDQGGFGHAGRYPEQIFATRIIQIAPLPQEDWDALTRRFTQQNVEIGE